MTGIESPGSLSQIYGHNKENKRGLLAFGSVLTLEGIPLIGYDLDLSASLCTLFNEPVWAAFSKQARALCWSLTTNETSSCCLKWLFTSIYHWNNSPNAHKDFLFIFYFFLVAVCWPFGPIVKDSIIDVNIFLWSSYIWQLFPNVTGQIFKKKTKKNMHAWL